jgi:hypothetical protein
MGLAISQLKPDDPRIHTVRGECGCVIRTTTSKMPQINAGERVYIHCRTCNHETIVRPYTVNGHRYCSSPRCARPDAPLSRYNKDPEGRCGPCDHRDREEWLAKLRNPGGTPRDLIRDYLASNGESTAVQIERATGVEVARVYQHLSEMAGEGTVVKHRPRKQLATYRLAENLAVAA